MWSSSPSTTRLKPLDGVLELYVAAGATGELLGDVERLREEALDLASAGDGDFVVLRELVDTEDGDDVLEVLVALQDLFHRAGDVVVLVTDDARVENARRRRERVHRGVDAELGDLARQVRRRVEMRERRRHARVGVVVSGDVDGLDRRDRALVRRRDPLFQVPELGRERRLVADGGRHAAEKGRHFHAREGVAVDVVDEQEHVLAFFVAEVLGDGETGERDPEANSRRLVHLTVDERRLLDNAGTLSSRARGRCLHACARPRRRTRRSRRAGWRCCG